jgi:hypothetical protein
MASSDLGQPADLALLTTQADAEVAIVPACLALVEKIFLRPKHGSTSRLNASANFLAGGAPAWCSDG